jgi:hypothetical protein
MMAKRKKAAKAIPADAHLGLLHGAKNQFGNNGAYASSLISERHIGLPLQTLAVEYLFGSNKLILGKSYGISGPPESFKSSLQLDFMRHIVGFTGAGFLVETEGEKISAPMVKSVCGGLSERITMRPVDSVDEAQAALTWVIEWLKREYPERNYLLAVGLDSLSGAATKERGAKIKKEGSAQRDYSSEALLWTQWLRTYASKLAGWPLTLMYVNHEKPKMEDRTGYGKSKGGGLAQDFYATVYMSINRVKEQKGSERTLTQLRIRTAKNSFGEHRRAIDTVFVYDHSGPEASMYFDWGHATAELLIQQKPAVKDLVSVTASSDTMTSLTRVFSCPQLGLKAVSGADLALAVQANEDLTGELRKRLGINDYAEWDGAMPLPEAETLRPRVDPCDHDADESEVDL